jgi:hypothetical protein
MHLPAQRNSWNDKEKHQESHPGLANELGLRPAGSAAHQLVGKFGSPEKNLRANDQHSARVYYKSSYLLLKKSSTSPVFSPNKLGNMRNMEQT